jgi:TonB family protein
MAEGIDGLVTVECRFDDKGLLRRCAVDNEAPLEQGFGEAALKLTAAFQAKMGGPSVVGGKVRIPVRFLAPPPALLSAAPTVLQPVWIRKPSAEDIARLYPAGAARRGLSGRVTLTCRIGADGRLPACGVGRVEVVGEQPATPDDEPDFGTATLRLANLFQMEPVSRDGVKTAGGVVRIPVRWSPPAGA